MAHQHYSTLDIGVKYVEQSSDWNTNTVGQVDATTSSDYYNLSMDTSTDALDISGKSMQTQIILYTLAALWVVFVCIGITYNLCVGSAIIMDKKCRKPVSGFLSLLCATRLLFCLLSIPICAYIIFLRHRRSSAFIYIVSVQIQHVTFSIVSLILVGLSLSRLTLFIGNGSTYQHLCGWTSVTAQCVFIIMFTSAVHTTVLFVYRTGNSMDPSELKFFSLGIVLASVILSGINMVVILVIFFRSKSISNKWNTVYQRALKHHVLFWSMFCISILPLSLITAANDYIDFGDYYIYVNTTMYILTILFMSLSPLADILCLTEIRFAFMALIRCKNPKRMRRDIACILSVNSSGLHGSR